MRTAPLPRGDNYRESTNNVGCCKNNWQQANGYGIMIEFVTRYLGHTYSSVYTI